MENQLATLLHRTAVLMNEDDDERIDTLEELVDALDDPQTNKTGSRAVLDNEEVMDVLLNLSAATGAASVADSALGVLLQVAFDLDNARRLFREHPSLILVAMRELEFRAESANEQVQERALDVLQSLACNVDNARDMTTKNPALVSLLMAKVDSDSEQVQVGALNVLQSLAYNDNNVREMATKYPTLVPLLMAKVESNSEEVLVGALGVLQNLADNNENARDMVTKNPMLVPLLVAKAQSISEQVQVEALDVLHHLAINVDNKREMVIKNPTLVSLLVTKVESNSEEVQVRALGVLNNLAENVDNARELVTQHTTLVYLLMSKVGSDLEQVQLEVLDLLDILVCDVDNARAMLARHVTLVPLLVAKMNGSTCLEASRAVYHLSCCLANRAILRGNDLGIVALTKGREDENEETSLLSILALVNLFGAEEDSEVLKTDLTTLQRIFSLIARAMDNDTWRLDAPLLAFRFLCAVEHNRQLLWDEYGSEFLVTILAALQRAIDDKDTSAVENAVSILVQFSRDPGPLAWMRSNKPQLDEVFDQLALFPDALQTAQALLFALGPPEVVAAPTPVAGSNEPVILRGEVEEDQAAAMPQGEEVASRLVKEDLAKALESKSAAELETLVEFNAKQALELEAASKEPVARQRAWKGLALVLGILSLGTVLISLRRSSVVI